jgi:hypothetical protein
MPLSLAGTATSSAAFPHHAIKRWNFIPSDISTRIHASIEILGMRLAALLLATTYPSDTFRNIHTSEAREGLAVETSVPLFLLHPILNAITNTVSLTQLASACYCLRTELSGAPHGMDKSH